MRRLKQIGIDVEVNGIIEKSRRTFSETENDILRRLLISDSSLRHVKPKQLPRLPEPSSLPTRARGLWTVELRGQRVAAPNLKGAYRILLLALHDAFPDFLQRFSLERSRSRRFVASSTTQLYLSSPELADDYAELLTEGWYFDTNLSTQQVAKRVRIAARLAGLLYGKDVRIMNNLEEI